MLHDDHANVLRRIIDRQRRGKFTAQRRSRRAHNANAASSTFQEDGEVAIGVG
jgi:hypothetical protein